MQGLICQTASHEEKKQNGWPILMQGTRFMSKVLVSPLGFLNCLAR